MAGASIQVPLTLTPGPPHVYGPAAIQAGITHLSLTISREDLNVGDSNGVEVVSLVSEISTDGGNVWTPGPGFGTARGTVINRKTGLPFTTSGIDIPLPSPCQIRGTVTVTEAFSTTLTVTTS